MRETHTHNTHGHTTRTHTTTHAGCRPKGPICFLHRTNGGRSGFRKEPNVTEAKVSRAAMQHYCTMGGYEKHAGPKRVEMEDAGLREQISRERLADCS